MNESPHTLQKQLKENHWGHSWVDTIYDFHHYHSNTHEVLVIISGTCQAQFGGENGLIYETHAGDVIIIPAGVAHKSLNMSKDFQCIGAYSSDVVYDMKQGDIEEYNQALSTIKKLGLPKMDPIFGDKGMLFNYWK